MMTQIMFSQLQYRNAARREDGIIMPYMTAWRGKRKVLDQVRNAATDCDTLAQIGPYLNAL
jgi:hypothetical protein